MRALIAAQRGAARLAAMSITERTMDHPDIDLPHELNQRRIFLGLAGAWAGAGALMAAYPFVASMEPASDAQAAAGPLDYDFAALRPGQLDTVTWRGRPVWIMRRTPDMVAALQRPDPLLADPLSRRSEQPAACANATRSLRPDLFVAEAVCTHLGCTPRLQLDDAALNASLQAPGGFVCPCHGSRFDLAGRVLRNVPAPDNLSIPPYALVGTSSLRIG
jgi:ubiquinol-cytochrome c reductase iron-sulfur subunit